MWLKIGFIIFSVSFLSCGVNQNLSPNIDTNSDAEIEAQKREGEKMMDAGYLPGRIVYSDLADDCEYTIQLKDGEKDFYYVDPLNLDENFSKDDKTVWVIYDKLERESRCEKAFPVEIIDIISRKE